MKKNKLILGTVQFGLDYGINNSEGKPSGRTIKKILDIAFENKIEILDSAEAYGNAQECIGDYHRNSSNTFKVITKFSTARTDLPDSIIDRVKHNLKTLRVHTLHTYMFHTFKDFETYYDRFKKDLQYLKENDLVERIGVSLHSNEEIKKTLQYDIIDVIQFPFNCFDNIHQRENVFSIIENRPVEIHTRSVFLQGLFFKNKNDLKGKMKVFEPYLSQLNEITTGEVKMNDLALHYVYGQSFIDHILIGVDTAEQLQSNLESLKKNISEEILQEVNRIHVKEASMLNPVNWN